MKKNMTFEEVEKALDWLVAQGVLVRAGKRYHYSPEMKGFLAVLRKQLGENAPFKDADEIANFVKRCFEKHFNKKMRFAKGVKKIEQLDFLLSWAKNAMTLEEKWEIPIYA